MKLTFVLLFIVQTLVIFGQSATEYLQLADEAMKFDQPATAVLYYTSAIELNPIDVKFIYLKRGIAHSRNNDFSVAIADFDIAIQHDGNFAIAYYYRSVAKGLSGLQEQAVSDFEYSVKLDSSLVANEIKNEDKRDNYRAVETKQVLKNKLRNSAIGLMINNNYLNALKKYNFMLVLNPKDSEALVLRSGAYSMLGEHANAILDLGNALNYNQGNHEIFYLRGVEKYAIGDKIGACEDWKNAIGYGSTKAQELINKHCK